MKAGVLRIVVTLCIWYLEPEFNFDKTRFFLR